MHRHLLILTIVLALVTSVVGIAHIAHAAAATTTTVAPTTQTASTASVPPGSDSPINANPGQTTASGFNGIMTWIVSLFALLVGAAALTLDYAVYYTVINMGGYVSHLSAVGTAWRIIRDLGNIFLIFGFLAAGIATILDVDLYGWGKKMLPALLIAAIFLNFSLFLSEAVIDMGNLLATQFYTQINGGSLPTPASLTGTNPSNEGISNAIMSQLGFSTLYPTNNPSVYTGNHAWLIGFLSIILFMITAFVMFSLAFILVARFVMLIFLLILSPVGFAGFAVPALAGKSKQWRDELFSQTITAPVLLLLLYVALAVITDAHFITGFNVTSGGWLGFINNTNLTGFASILLSFLVAMGLLLYVTVKAKDLGAIGAAGATKLAGKLTFGIPAFALRSTLGAGSRMAAQRIKTSGLAKTRTGRLLASTFDRGAKASFDVRGSSVGRTMQRFGVDTGNAQKGGYQARRENATKAHEEYLKSVDRAIDEKGWTMEERKNAVAAAAATARAGKNKEAAKREIDKAENERNAAAEQVDTHKANVKRLEDAEKLRAKFQKQNSLEEQRELDTARGKLTESQGKLATAVDKLSQAEKKHETAKEAEEEAGKAEKEAAKAGDKRMSNQKREVKLGYAERIEVGEGLGGRVSGLASWAMFGPGGSAVANKIIRDTIKKKSEVDEAMETLKKAMEKEAKATEGVTKVNEKLKEAKEDLTDRTKEETAKL